MVAPMMPPIRACDELEGMPYHQVSRFQKIADRSAAATMPLVTICGSTMPLPMVLATAVLMNAPAKLRAAESRMAVRGESTRVETTVAIAFAESCIPLM